MKAALFIFIVASLVAHRGQSGNLLSPMDEQDWVFIAEKDAPSKASTHTFLPEGGLRFSGQPRGYLRSTQSFSNYRLTLQWRWLVAPGNSGILLHLAGADAVWPRSVQIQLRSKRAGEVILIGRGTHGRTASEIAVIDSEQHPYYAFDRGFPSSEKPVGEWNECEIIARDDTLSVEINGVVQNVLTELNLTRGPVAFQAAGQSIEFRKIELVPLEEIAP